MAKNKTRTDKVLTDLKVRGQLVTVPERVVKKKRKLKKIPLIAKRTHVLDPTILKPYGSLIKPELKLGIVANNRSRPDLIVLISYCKTKQLNLVIIDDKMSEAERADLYKSCSAITVMDGSIDIREEVVRALSAGRYFIDLMETLPKTFYCVPSDIISLRGHVVNCKQSLGSDALVSSIKHFAKEYNTL